MIKRKNESNFEKSGKDILPVPKMHADKKKDIGRNSISGEKKYNQKLYKKERPISQLYPVIDTDIARDNIENDLTSADFQDLEKPTNS